MSLGTIHEVQVTSLCLYVYVYVRVHKYVLNDIGDAAVTVIYLKNMVSIKPEHIAWWMAMPRSRCGVLSRDSRPCNMRGVSTHQRMTKAPAIRSNGVGALRLTPHCNSLCHCAASPTPNGAGYH
jgi:hypothetical protein